MGRARDGFYVMTADGEYLYWTPPGEYRLLGQNEDQGLRFFVGHGAFQRELAHRALVDDGLDTRDWADRVGVDEYGAWAEVMIQDVAMRLRWIPAGEFWMGSPEDEPARGDDEVRHRVLLTRGYWLAETTVTQALWQAVMGDSPSHFKGRLRPVESISWDDCRSFLKAVNQYRHGLVLRLPTEAEWEYACRAGTTGPFWFGDNMDSAQINYHGDHRYFDGSKGAYRRESVDVKSLACNAWGLYEMHGNVREWCVDWYGDYPFGPTIDPMGPKMGEERVVRGGSWISDGGWVRSAYRNRWQSDFVGNYTGLRLARGEQTESSRAGRAWR
jgi:formylglycine-generating enzyme required for sulfatase activity